MRILVTGGQGMLGRTLQRWLADHELGVADLPEVDITSLPCVETVVRQFRPEVVIHAAAMTAVDQCESERDAAFRVNALGSANVAMVCELWGARLVAVSTDYVFDGDLDRPYHEWDVPAPRTAYGASKLAGEKAVQAYCSDHCIVRLGWLYGPGGPSFVHTMLRLAGESGAPVQVVQDQIGNPTSTDAAAERLVDLVAAGARGTFHLTCEGEASWYDLARAVVKRAGGARSLVPCSTVDYPRPAPRPANSRLEKRALRQHGFSPMRHWEEALDRFFANPRWC